MKWHDHMYRLKEEFLGPQGDGTNKLHTAISTLLDNLPKQVSGDCILGMLNDSHSYLQDHKQVPKDGINLDKRFEFLGKVFSGTIAFQHQNVMHNVTPSPLISSVAASSITQLLNINPA